MRARRGTGDCYETAARLVVFDQFDGLVVHGTVTGRGPVTGIRFGHAWIESGDLAFDFSNGGATILPREVYYREGEIEETEVRRYTRAEATIHMARHQHFGPWEPVVGADA